MQNLQSKRFVVRKSLIGKNQIIEVTFKNGKSFTYNHDKVYEIMINKCASNIKRQRSNLSLLILHLNG